MTRSLAQPGTDSSEGEGRVKFKELENWTGKIPRSGLFHSAGETPSWLEDC